MNRKISRIFMYIPILWVIAGFIIYPLVNTLIGGFTVDGALSIGNYAEFLSSSQGMKIVLNTVVLGLATIAVCGVVGTGMALFVSMTDIKAKKLLNTLLLTPVMVPGVLIVIAFIQLYGESGIVTKLFSSFINVSGIKGFWGILFIHACTQYVYFYMNVTSTLSSLDYSQIEAARSMGAGRFYIFRRIIFPFIKPALFSSSIVTFMSGISSFSAPNLLGGYKVLSTQIMYSKINNRLDAASMQVTLMLVMGLFVMLVFRVLEEKSTFQNNIKGTPFVPYKLNGFKGCFSKLLIWAAAIFIASPVICVCILSFADSADIMTKIVPTSFSLDNYLRIFSKKRVLKPFVNSLNMTLISVCISLLITLPAAYFSVKRKNKFTHFMELCLMLPIAIPVGSIAINLINAFNRKNIFSFGRPLIGTYMILPIAYVLLTIPMLLRSNVIAMEKFNDDLEYSAKSLGADSRTTFFKVTLREVLPFVVSGSVLAYVRTFGEYTVSAFLYGVHNKPVSIAMVNALQEYDLGLSMAYGTLTVAVCFTGVLITQLISKKYD